MRRRDVLQLGAAAAVLPVVGCAAPPEPAHPAAPLPVAASASNAPAPAPIAQQEKPIEPPPHEPAPAAASPAFSRVVARMGKNHGHELVVALADVQAGAEKTYDVRGKASHGHRVTVTVEDMKALATGKLLRTRTTTENHSHRVTIRCAPPVDPPEWVSVCTFHSSGADEHELIVTAADLEAGVEKTYDVQGLAGHTHQVTLTAADFQKLTVGGPVTSHTTRDPDDAHLHTVTVERIRLAKT